MFCRDHLRIFIEIAHKPFLVTLVVFLSDEELTFLLLFETIISQACKFGAHRNPKPLRFASFSGNSAAVFSCLFVFLQRSDPHQPLFRVKTSTRPKPPGNTFFQWSFIYKTLVTVTKF